MTKKVWTVICAAACAAALAGCTAQGASAAASGSGVAPVASPSNNVSAGIAGSAQSGSGYITEQQAKDAAFGNAGLAEADAQWLWVRLDYDDGRAVYDVEFVVGADEYDYEIDAVTGDVLSMDREAEYRAGGAGQTASAASSAAFGAADGTIGEEAAKQAALDHAGLAGNSAVQFARVKLERDDGRMVYDVEFWLDSAEYDYEIDAATGEVLSYDFDAEYYTPAQSASGAAVTAEQAKQIALAHAGVSEADAGRMEMDRDREHGREVYEFSWQIGFTEYEYEIDAATGEILSYSQELDD